MAIRGERRLTEWVADWLPGFENSMPVRIGECGDTSRSSRSISSARSWIPTIRRGAAGLTTDESGWGAQLKFLEHLTKIWRQPDQGIWEMRGPPQRFADYLWLCGAGSSVPTDAIKSAEDF